MRLALVLVMVATAACSSSSRPAPQPPAAPAVAADPTPLSAEALVSFVGKRFPKAVADGDVTLDFGSAGVETDLLRELDAMGFHTVGELAAIVPPDFETKGIGANLAAGAGSTTIAGLVRDLLVIHDIRGYFTKAWNDTWAVNGPSDFPAPAAYGVDFSVLDELTSGDDGDMGPCDGGDGYDPCDGW